MYSKNLRRGRSLGAIAVLAATALTLSACGSGGTDDALGSGGATGTPAGAAAAFGGDAVDPCDLLPQADLESALGRPLAADGPAEPSSGGLACSWSFEDEASAVPGSLSITTWHGTEFFSDALGDPLPGIGDDARIDPGLGAVLFKSGEDIVQVQVLPSRNIDAASEIARDAAGAL